MIIAYVLLWVLLKYGPRLRPVPLISWQLYTLLIQRLLQAAPGCSDETIPVNGTSPQARRRRGKAWEGVVYQFVTTGAPGADRKVVGGLWRLANAI